MRRTTTVLVSLATLVALASVLLPWRSWGSRIDPINLTISYRGAVANCGRFAERLAQSLEGREGIGIVEVCESSACGDAAAHLEGAQLGLEMESVLLDHPRREDLGVLMPLFELSLNGDQGGERVLLAGNHDLPGAVAADVVDAALDNIGVFAEAGIVSARDILIGFPVELTDGLERHPGLDDFEPRDRQRVLIASGSLNGKYYQVGKRIETLLRLNGIPARVIVTEGSVANLELLAAEAEERRPTLAIVQYDAALASYFGSAPQAADGHPKVGALRRVATLHAEVMHVIARRPDPPEDPDERLAGAGEQPTLRLLAGKKVVMGAENSGTRSLAEAILRDHRVELPEENKYYLPAPEMVARLNSDDEDRVDAGFFVSHLPSEGLKSVAHDRRFHLLSIEPRFVAGLLGPALHLTRIEPGTYGSQLAGEPPIDTVGTWAVLVTRNDLSCPWTWTALVSRDRLGCDVKWITRTVFEGSAFLGINTDAASLSRDLSSLPLHPGSEVYYRKARYLPSGSVNWLARIGELMGLLVVLAGAYRGLLSFRRDKTRRQLSQAILGVPLGAGYPDSATDLMELRREVRRRAHLSAWRAGQLDSGLAAELEQQIAKRIDEAKERLKQALLVGARALGHAKTLDPSTVDGLYASLEKTAWGHLERGELDPSQHELLLAVIREGKKARGDRE